MNAHDPHLPAGEPPESHRPYEFVAKHVNAAFIDRVRACREVLSQAAAPHHLAHFSGTVLDFSLDTFEAHSVPKGGRWTRDQLVRLGQQLCLLFGGLDDALGDVRSGALIRLVAHTSLGACYCDQIVPGQLVVGTRFEPVADDMAAGELPIVAGVRDADRIVARLVTDVRHSLRQGSENPGGYEPGPGVEQVPAVAAPGQLRVECLVDGDVTAAFVKAASGALYRSALHYVALCRDAEIMAAVDRLDHGELNGYFTQISVGARRAFYADFGRGVGFLVGRLGRMSLPVLGGPLRRVVLDVQQGALYYYRLRPGVYLLGVTLDQNKVSDVDDQMAELAGAAAVLVNG